MGAVGGLILDRRVPPRIEVDDGVGRGEVEAGAARLEADEEHRQPRIVLEAVDALGAVLGGAVEVLVGDAVLLSSAFSMSCSIDHELAEDEHLVPALRLRSMSSRSATSLPESSSVNVARQPEQPRIAGRLPEPREAGEDLDAGSSATPSRSTSPRTCARTSRDDLRVERPLLAGEIADLIDLDLLGQILGDLLLGAAQDERVDGGAQALRGLVVAVARSGARSAPRTCRAARAGPGETKSKIDQISESRFSMGVPVSASRRLARRRLAAAAVARHRVLDVLRLVEDGVGEVELLRATPRRGGAARSS